MTERRPDLTRDELAMMAMFEARTGDAPQLAEAKVSSELQDELDAYVALAARVGGLPLEPVRPSVRSAIMNAAVSQIETAAEPTNPLARLLVWLMRPGPALIGATGIALVAAMFVRTAPTEDAAKASGAMVAMAETPKSESPAAASPEAAAVDQVFADKLDRAAAEGSTSRRGGAPAGSMGDDKTPESALLRSYNPAIPDAVPTINERAPRRRTFAAQPASLGPVKAVQGVQRKSNAAAKVGVDDLVADQAQVANSALGGKRADRKSGGVKGSMRAAKRRYAQKEQASKDKESRVFAQPPAADDDSEDESARPSAPPLATKAAPPPRWSNPPARSGDSRKPPADDKRKLAKNAFYGGRNQAPVAAGSAPQRPSATSRGAPVQEMAQRDRYVAKEAVARTVATSSRPSFGAAKKPSGQAKKTAGSRTAGDTVLKKLRAQLNSTKTYEQRIKVLAQIIKTARKSGDKKTEAWARRSLTELQQTQIASGRKSGTEKKASTKAAKAKSAPNRPGKSSTSGAPPRANGSPETVNRPPKSR